MLNRPTLAGIVSFILIFCACPVALAQFWGIEERLVQAHAYEGDARPATQIATVFAPFGIGPPYGYICKVDEKSVVKWRGCPAVVYLLPGTHQLTVRFVSGSASASPTVAFRAEAGKTYMVMPMMSGGKNIFGVEVPNSRVAASVSTMPKGFVLTYKDIDPVYFAKYPDKPNSPVNPLSP